MVHFLVFIGIPLFEPHHIATLNDELQGGKDYLHAIRDTFISSRLVLSRMVPALQRDKNRRRSTDNIQRNNCPEIHFSLYHTQKFWRNSLGDLWSLQMFPRVMKVSKYERISVRQTLNSNISHETILSTFLPVASVHIPKRPELVSFESSCGVPRSGVVSFDRFVFMFSWWCRLPWESVHHKNIP